MNRSFWLNTRGSRAPFSIGTSRTALRSFNLLAAASVIALIAALGITSAACAQSTLDSLHAVDSSALVSGAPETPYALPAPAVPLADPTTDGDAISDSNPPDDPEPDIPVLARKDSSSNAASHSGWDRIGDTDTESESEDPSNKVLEVPQVVTPPEAQQSPANSDENSDQTADEGGSSPSDQVGSADDYKDEQYPTVMGVYIAPVPFQQQVNPYVANNYRSYPGPVNPSFGPNFVPTAPFRLGQSQPLANGLNTMNSAIMRTSPMFPHGGPSMGMWTRTH
jgi:hypothetical protein